MAFRTLVCLANSKKGNGYCVAGVDSETLEWLRPIGSGWDGAVMLGEQTLDDGSRPALLDLVEVPLERRAPQPGQPENWKIREGPWKLVGRLSGSEGRQLLNELRTREPLFGNRGKAIPIDAVAGLQASLAVVRPEQVIWRKVNAKRLYAVFDHAGRELDLKVSDPDWFERFRDDPAGTYEVAEALRPYLTISVTAHDWHGFHWKLVAAVINL